MILIEGIPVVAARIAAEIKEKQWLAKTRRRASEKTVKAAPVQVVTRSAKAA